MFTHRSQVAPSSYSTRKGEGEEAQDVVPFSAAAFFNTKFLALWLRPMGEQQQYPLQLHISTVMFNKS
jgi:hypothetical protein